MNNLQDRIARLPAWAREHIKRLEDQIEAMTEIFRCAARGGSEVAQAYVSRILGDYGVDPKYDTAHPEGL